MTMIEYPNFPSREKKEALRDQIRRDMEAFLERGGKVKECGRQETGCVYSPKFNASLNNA